MAFKTQSHKDLIAWQKSIQLVEIIYKMTQTFPKEELYGLTSQVRRATVSVAMNIAEGTGADSDGELKRFLVMAARSCYEVMCGIEVAMRLQYLAHQQGEKLLDRVEELSAMIHGFVRKLRAGR